MSHTPQQPPSPTPTDSASLRGHRVLPQMHTHYRCGPFTRYPMASQETELTCAYQHISPVMGGTVPKGLWWILLECRSAPYMGYENLFFHANFLQPQSFFFCAVGREVTVSGVAGLGHHLGRPKMQVFYFSQICSYLGRYRFRHKMKRQKTLL